jgi:hypothetical protein
MAMIAGLQILFFALFTKVYASKAKLLHQDKNFEAKLERLTLERGIVIGSSLVLIGILATIFAFVYWSNKSLGDLVPSYIMRVTIPAVTLFVIGIQITFSSFFFHILHIKHE